MKSKHIIMKKIIPIIFLFVNATAFSQSKLEQSKIIMASGDSVKANSFRELYPNACNVYNSAEDYYKNNPVENMEWHVWNSGSQIEITRYGHKDMERLSEINNFWFSDQNGLLVRNFQNKLYRVVIDGPICYYAEVFNGEVYKDTDSTFEFFPSPGSGNYFEYYSMTVKSDLKVWSDKVFENYLKDFGLYEQYKSDIVQRYTKDSVWDLESRRLNKRLKYLRMVNAKLAEK
jgi:hypothetical protein